MTTIVCQNIMTSHFESQVVNETTATLKLKVPNENEFGNWGSIQTTPKQKEPNSYTYTHNSSFSRLNPISLELCTENLGSETGSDIITDTAIFSTSTQKNSWTSHKRVVEYETTAQNTRTDRNTRKSFPPPLTSSLQVRHRREGGRLIIEAVEAPFRNSYLQAERSEGRLKLCYLTSFDATETAPTVPAVSESENENEIENEEECEMVADEEIETPLSENEWENEEFNEEMENNSEIGIEKFQWIGRCKENGHGNKGLCNNWKPALWVATS